MSATLTTLVGFDGANGEEPEGDLIADSSGDLFGTTIGRGADGAARCSRLPRPPWLCEHSHDAGQLQR